MGSNLVRQYRFSELFNSRNIDQLHQQEFELAICAAASAVKWKANLYPEDDWRAINGLIESLGRLICRKFILISTVDVYPIPNLVTEDLDLSNMANHVYGTHRLQLEKFVTGRFTDCHIIRLPGLFGAGLKKNVIFDLINNKGLETINPGSTYQYYDLSRLSSDLNRLIDHDIRLLNMATEPISTEEIVQRFFPGRVIGNSPGPIARYDFRSRYSSIWGSETGYLYAASAVLDGLRRYLVSLPEYSAA